MSTATLDPLVTKTIKVPQQLFREATIRAEGEGADQRFRMSISSDEPYLRYDWWNDEEYWEILSHAPGDIEEARLKAGLPILFNHSRDQHLARATKYSNNGHRIEVTDFIWSESEFAKSKKADAVTGALPDTSVGYTVDDEGECIGEKDGKPIYKFRWTPFEGSIVTVPADIKVGVGRSRDNKPDGEPKEISIAPEKNSLDANRTNEKPPITEKPSKGTKAMPELLEAPEKQGLTETEVAEREKGATERERARVKKINDHVGTLTNEAWKKAAAEIAIKAIEEGTDFESFRTAANNAFETATKEQIDTSGSETETEGQRPCGGPSGQRRLTAGERFVAAKGFKEFVEAGKKGEFRAKVGGSILAEHGLGLAQRAGFNSTDLGAVNVTISQEMISLGVQRLTVMDLMAGGVMTTAGFIYPVENSFDPFAEAALMVPERGLKPEWEPDITTARADAQVVAVMATVPKQFMADFGAFSSWLNSRGDYLLQIKLEQQLLYGDGLGSNLLGITARPGIQARAYGTVGSETTPDALFRGNTDIETNAYFDPDGFAMHPYDFEQIRLLKDANGQYLGGGPFYAPYGNGTFLKYHTIWGLPCVVSKSVKQGKPIAGAWKMGAQWFLREGLQIETSTSHKDYFQRNLLAVLFEERMALAVYRPIAFLEHTGFPGRS